MLNKRFVSIAGLCALLIVTIVLQRADAQRSGYNNQHNSYNSQRNNYGQRRGTYQNRNYSNRRRANIAGEFDYYAMVLSWSPSYCASIGSRRRDPQCDPRARPYSFVLHGLWPQYESRWPENCRTRQRPFVSRQVIRSMLNIMPSKGLIIHEYKKHGTCSGYGPKGYYELARRLYSKIKIPARYIRPNRAVFVTPDQMTRDFVAANPGLKPGNLAISCRSRRGTLREIRFCFARDGSLRNCGRNENRRRMCSARRLYLPPVRQSR